LNTKEKTMFPISNYGVRVVHEQMVKEAMEQARIASEVRRTREKRERSYPGLVGLLKALFQRKKSISEDCPCALALPVAPDCCA
jgi:hypothetical protein